MFKCDPEVINVGEEPLRKEPGLKNTGIIGKSTVNPIRVMDPDQLL